MKLLAIDSSILGEHSVSHRLMGQYLDYWKRDFPEAKITYRDFNVQPINHLSSELINSKQKPVEELSAALKSELDVSEQLINEFLSADEIVIGAPMYNFSIPTQLKAWIDRILVAGRTFKYTEQGVIGLAADKKITIISTRGNHYSSDAMMKAKDYQENYLQTIFNFIGVTQVTIIRAEGLHLGEAQRDNAVTLAEQEIRGLFLR